MGGPRLRPLSALIRGWAPGNSEVRKKMGTRLSRTLGACVTAALVAAGVVVPALPASAATVGDAWTDKARYSPGQPVTVTAEVTGSGPVNFSLVHLGSVVRTGTVQATSAGTVTWDVTPPTTDFTGYMVHADAGGTSTQTAVDVSSNWTKFPRMGYLDEYSAGMTATERQKLVKDLSDKYHLNALQFYDWMWRHETPIKRNSNGDLADTWTAWNGDVIAPATVAGLVDASHNTNIAALPYSMSYAALEGYETHGVSADWRLKYRSDDTDWKFMMLPGRPDTTLSIMDPTNPNWRQHITDEYKDQIDTLGFDGTHLDQLGNWGNGASDGGMKDVSGNPVDIPIGFKDLIADTKTKTGKPVGFNAVDGFAGSTLASSGSDYLYTELWENHETYAQVQSYLADQRTASGGKAAVTAAYLNYRSNTGDRYETENGTLVGVQSNNNHTGYTGTGFIDQFGETGDSVTFTVTVPESRRYGIVPAWSNGTPATATRTVLVDGAKAGQLKMTPTSGWDAWNTEAGFGTYLTAGTHSIRVAVETTDTGFVNLDSITLGTFNTPSVKLANAAVAASGASHIEMGQGDQMLVAPYFLDDSKQMSNELQAWMESYYDVITGYENLLYGPTLRQLSNAVQITGQTTSNNGTANTIWATSMRNEGLDVLHLINLKGNDGHWRDAAAPAPTQTNLPVKYYLDNKPFPAAVNIASPDNGGRSQTLAYTTGTDAGGNYISFVVPELKNWSFIYFGDSTQGSGNVVNQASKCLDVAGGNTADGTPIQLWDCASVPAMRWSYQNNKLSALGKCLDLVAGGTTDGTQAHLWTCSSTASQTWERTAQGQYYNPASSKCLDLTGGSTANGTRAHIWTCQSGASQKWTTPQ
jgi:hypothetical protein